MKSSGLKSLTSPAIWHEKSDASNLVIGPMPDLPAHTASQFLSIPVPRGVTIPKPVTTTLLFISSYSFLRSCSLSKEALRLFRQRLIDIVDSILDCGDLFGILIRNGDVKLLFHCHYQLNLIKGISA